MDGAETSVVQAQIVLCARFVLETGVRLSQKEEGGVTKTPPQLLVNTHASMPRSYVTPRGVTLTFERALGQGQFGIANAVKNRKGDLFCMKEVSVRIVDEEAKEEVQREVDVMRETCHHTNIVKFYDSWFERNRLCILMEYCANGSLDKLITRFATAKKTFPAQKVTHYTQELVSALRYCHHDVHVMHRDLKPANILIDEIGTLKLADFGLAKSLTGEADVCATFCGSPLYMSPEQCTGKTYTYSSDMWALGCILYELLTLQSPWVTAAANTYPNVVNKIIEGRPAYDKVSDTYPSTLVDLCKWMLRKTPSERGTALEIEAHMEMRAPPALFASMRAVAAPPCAVPVPAFPPTPPSAAAPMGALPSPLASRQLRESAMHTLERREELVAAAKRIQRSFRVSVDRRMGGPPPLRPLKLVDKHPPPKVPDRYADRHAAAARHHVDAATNEESSRRIQTAFRTSFRRRNAPAPRIQQLAAPKNYVRVPRGKVGPGGGNELLTRLPRPAWV